MTSALPHVGDDGRLSFLRAAMRNAWRPVAQATLFAIAVTVTAAAAQAQTLDTEPASQGWLERSTLTGDWNGQRPALEERGVAIGLALYQDALFTRGGGATGNDFPGMIEPSLSLDLERLFGWKNTTVFIRGVGMYGNDPAEAAGSLNAPSNIANAVSTFTLIEGWIERSFLDDRLSVRAGLYAADSEFDVKETAGVFMNGGFGTGIDLSESGLNGPCIFPASCVGVRVKYAPTPATYAMVAMLDGVAGDPDDPYGTHIHLGNGDGELILGEVGYQRGADEGRFVRAAVGAWHYTTKLDDVLATDINGDPLRRDGTNGIYALVEGELYREPGQISQGLSGFLRVGLADEDVNPVEYYASAGFAYTGLVPGRDEDVFGFAVSAPINGDKYKRAMALAGTPVDDQEIAFELAYLMPITPWFAVQFDAQYIVNPGADPTLDDARLLGLRLNFTF